MMSSTKCSRKRQHTRSNSKRQAKTKRKPNDYQAENATRDLSALSNWLDTVKKHLAAQAQESPEDIIYQLMDLADQMNAPYK